MSDELRDNRLAAIHERLSEIARHLASIRRAVVAAVVYAVLYSVIRALM